MDYNCPSERLGAYSFKRCGVKILPIISLMFLLSACGFKGPLYLPKKDDDQTFGVVQTGFGIDSETYQGNPAIQTAPRPY